MNIVFMGTPDFAVHSLKAVYEKYDIKAVITQPDRPKGRGKKLASPPVKVFAKTKGITVYQPENINKGDFVDLLKKLNPDVVVVAAYGKILSKDVLKIPRLGCINLHASLLPKYRGSAPIHWAIINGEKKTGVTTIYMNERMDAGDMILQKEVDILPDCTAGELHDKLAVVGSSVLVNTLDLIFSAKAPRIPQEHEKATYAPMIHREHERIDWKKESWQVKNHIRGMNPWPGAFTNLNDKVLKIWNAKTVDIDADARPGTVLHLDNNGIIVKTGSGCISVLELQLQGKKKITAGEFLRGNKIEIGTVLGGTVLV